MKKAPVYSILVCFLCFGGFAQVFWTEDFGTGCSHLSFTTANGAWVENTSVGVNGADKNEWYMSAQENGNAAGACGSGCGTDKSLHIGANTSVTGDGGAAYLAGGLGFFFPETHTRIESPVINCTGQSNILMSFNYIEFGDGANDDAELWYFDGASWSLLSNLPKTSCCGGPCNGSVQGLWQAFSISLPASANNNPNVRIGFFWQNNDDNIGTDPSFAVDDIDLSTTAGGSPTADFSADNDTICVNDSIQFTDLSTNAPDTWAWSSSPAPGVAFNTATSQNPSATFSAAGNYTITLVAANISGSDTDTLVVTILPLPSVTAGILSGFNDTICAGGTTQLEATGALTYIWSMNEGLSDSTVFNPVFDSTLTSSYTVTGTDASGCVSSASVTVTVIQPPVVTVNGPFSVCEGNSVSFTASGASTYSWAPGTFLSDSTSANPLGSPSTSTAYTVTGTDSLGCSGTATTSVTVNPSAAVSGSTGQIPFGIPASVNFFSTASNADSVLWNFGDGSPTDTTSDPAHTFSAAGTYTVTLIAYNASGCNDTTTFVVALSSASSLVVPNFFTPNYDDLNDVFRPIQAGIKEFYCVIYDRWGLKIYEWDRPNGWWDGHSTSGMPCPEGVYFFIMKATGEDGKEYDEKGYIHLFR